MNIKSRAYSSRNWQISTPEGVVNLFWRITYKHRNNFANILDMGAGDGRFAPKYNFQRYEGIEIDHKFKPIFTLSNKLHYLHRCVFEYEGTGYSACIGNPPYLRHNELGFRWRNRITGLFKEELGITFDNRANLFTYFIALGLLKTSEDGLVALLIPYEWTHRPSVTPLRDYIKKNKWNVTVYKLNYTVFEDVFTTASISIIDKSRRDGIWSYKRIEKNQRIKSLRNLTDTELSPLNYESRGQVWGLRGLSPGTQKVFTLNEQQRKKYGLTRKDVRPCVTTFKHIKNHFDLLDKQNFEKYFVKKNRRCWLIKTDKELTNPLIRYLRRVPIQLKNTWTCENRRPWYRYCNHPIPKILVNTTFKSKRPQIVINSIGAIAVGAIMGIHSNEKVNVARLQRRIIASRFYERILAYENGLKKIAIRQMNTVLNRIYENGF